MEEKKNIIFKVLLKYIDEDEKILLNDFMKLHYYFIVCYSKNCYKKYASWQSKYNKKSIFKYNTMDNSEAQKKLLDIQSRIIKYRNEYKKTNEQQYFTKDKITEILDFVLKSIYLYCTDIRAPVQFISSEINALLQFYKEKHDHELKHKEEHKEEHDEKEDQEETHKDKKQKSSKLNYDVLAELGIAI